MLLDGKSAGGKRRSKAQKNKPNTLKKTWDAFSLAAQERSFSLSGSKASHSLALLAGREKCQNEGSRVPQVLLTFHLITISFHL